MIVCVHGLIFMRLNPYFYGKTNRWQPGPPYVYPFIHYSCVS